MHWSVGIGWVGRGGQPGGGSALCVYMCIHDCMCVCGCMCAHMFVCVLYMRVYV
jgi:hypothetical protein